MPSPRFRALPILLPILAPFAFADGRIVVVTDEWPLTTGRAFNAPNDAAVFVTNVADWFTGGETGRFLAYSTHASLSHAQIRGAMEAAGHEWVVNAAADTSLANLLTFNGVFVVGRAIDTTAFSNYLNAGGNVYIAAGAGGAGGAANEAAWYNPILEPRGLQLAAPYSVGGLDVPISGSSPLLAGVDHLYAFGANQLSDLTPSDPRSTIIFSHSALKIAVYDDQCSLDGDVNCDCAVDLTDLSTLLQNFGSIGGMTRAQGDLNGDANVDLIDLAALLANFGSTCG
ncbi:MAG: hypothetical protein ACKVS9_10465 [Phycisphaerae bacterium]